MKRKIELWRDDVTGEISDGVGMLYSLPQIEEGSVAKRMYKVGSLDSFGDVTITGNLTVQQSQWVYLRGPITSSGILINGSATASNLWIRDRRGDATERENGFGNLIVDTDIVLGGLSLKEALDRIKVLESEIQRLKRNG